MKGNAAAYHLDPRRIAARSCHDFGPENALRNPGLGEAPRAIGDAAGRLQHQPAVQTHAHAAPPPRTRTLRHRSISACTTSGSPARVQLLPDALSRLTARWGDHLGRGPWCTTALALLAQDSTAPAEAAPLTRPLRPALSGAWR